MDINQYIDHTLLKPTATLAAIEKLCKEAIEYGFFSVCVNSAFVKSAQNFLFPNTNVKICSVIGFPLGAMSTEAKLAEMKQAKIDGAHEFDMVINIGWLKSGKDDLVREEIAQMKLATGHSVLKVIIETCYLSDDEIVKASKIAVAAGADFVKTSTGFGTGLKASGGIRDLETAKKYIDAGVSRIGTSNGIAIVTGTTSQNNY